MVEKFIIKSGEWDENVSYPGEDREWGYNCDEFTVILRLLEKTGDVSFYGSVNSCLDSDNCFFYDLLDKQNGGRAYLKTADGGDFLRFVRTEDGLEAKPLEEIEVPLWFVEHAQTLWDEEDRMSELFRDFVREDEANREGLFKFDGYEGLHNAFHEWMNEKYHSTIMDEEINDIMFVAHEWGLWFVYHINGVERICIDA